MSVVSKFQYWTDFEVVPVSDVADVVASVTEGRAWVNAALKG